jgi:hypothetical protein
MRNKTILLLTTLGLGLILAACRPDTNEISAGGVTVTAVAPTATQPTNQHADRHTHHPSHYPNHATAIANQPTRRLCPAGHSLFANGRRRRPGRF